LSVYLGTLGMTGTPAWVGLNLVEVKAVGAFIGLFEGHNVGKMVVELG
jgi:NADPH-dependent curcumin reductase CurA